MTRRLTPLAPGTNTTTCNNTKASQVFEMSEQSSLEDARHIMMQILGAEAEGVHNLSLDPS